MIDSAGPIFILGFPRSGTTAIARALGKVEGIQDFSAEGHYLYFLAEMLEQLRKGDGVNPASLLCDAEKYTAFEQEIALAVTRFNQRILSPPLENQIWVDKTPDLRQVQNVPVYARIFKGARFIFMYRCPLEVVESNLSNWPEIGGRALDTARRWVRTMATWRLVRALISAEAYLEVHQADMRDQPDVVMSKVGAFLGLSEDASAKTASFLQEHRVNTRRRKNDAPKVTLNRFVRWRAMSIVASERNHWPELRQSSEQ